MTPQIYSADILKNRFNILKANRSSLETDWRNVLLVTTPTRDQQDFFNSSIHKAGGAISSSQYTSIRALHDNHGATASLTLASYLHSSLTNPHNEWMKLQEDVVYSYDPEFEAEADRLQRKQELYTIQKVLDFLSAQCHLEWQSSNFHQEMFSFYKELVDLGTACFHVYMYMKGSNLKLVFKSRSIFDVYFTEDGYGNPNHTFCVYNWDARQIISRFGFGMNDMEIQKRFGKEIYDAYKKMDTRTFTFIHAVYPNYSQDSLNRKFIETYFLYENNYRKEWNWSNPKSGLMNKAGLIGGNTHNTADDPNKGHLYSGYLMSNPYIISRIRKRPNSIYGSGFSMEAFPSLIQLQQIQRAMTIAAQKNVEPPLNVPSSRLISKYSSRPNAKNPFDTIGGRPVSITPSIPLIDLQQIMMVKESLKNDIDKTYLIDRIQIEQTKRNRTATEVQKRTGEEIKLLSPFIGSLENEFLHPIVDVTLSILKMRKESIFKEAFRILSKIKYGLKYVSDIAQAQMKANVHNIIELFQYKKMLSEADPKVMKTSNWIRTIRQLEDYLATPKKIGSSPEEFNKEIQALQRQQMEQQKVQESAMLKDLGQGYQNFQQGATLAQQREGVIEQGQGTT